MSENSLFSSTDLMTVQMLYGQGTLLTLHVLHGEVEHIRHNASRPKCPPLARPSLALAADDLGMLRETRKHELVSQRL